MSDEVDTSIYNEEFFTRMRTHESYVNDHRVLADTISAVCKPKYAIDIGCGNGQILHRLETKYKIKVKGFEGSTCAAKSWDDTLKGKIVIANCTKDLPDQEKADTVICLEVAEHVPTEASDALVTNLTTLASEYIVFSAAPPGQGGVAHINEQHWTFWQEKFSTRKFYIDEQRTQLFKSLSEKLLRCAWYKKNIVVLRRSNVPL